MLQVPPGAGIHLHLLYYTLGKSCYRLHLVQEYIFTYYIIPWVSHVTGSTWCRNTSSLYYTLGKSWQMFLSNS